MIQKDCFTKEWIEQVKSNLNYPDVNLIEKVIRAFSLVEMLTLAGCPYIWKGGSSLMLLLAPRRNRLSIDVDIICPPGTEIEKYLTRYKDFGFTESEPKDREQPGTDIPKSHQKLHYNVAYLSNSDRKESILLDVLYEDAQYEKVETLKVESPFIRLDGEPLTVRIPSVNDIMGDKLTAFAPNTSGIPYYKKGEPKFVEIIKQLYDIGRLFECMTDLQTVARVFGRILPIEMSYRHLENNPAAVYADIRDTAMCLAARGKAGNGNFEALQSGINFIRPFMYQGKYYIEDAILDGAKAAYLATAIETGATTLVRYEPSAELPELRPTISNKVNKLKGFQSEAYFYWAQTSILLDKR